jgi:hypothetical protein
MLTPAPHRETLDCLIVSMASTASFGDTNCGLQVGQSLAPITAGFYLPPGELRDDSI